MSCVRQHSYSTLLPYEQFAPCLMEYFLFSYVKLHFLRNRPAFHWLSSFTPIHSSHKRNRPVIDRALPPPPLNVVEHRQRFKSAHTQNKRNGSDKSAQCLRPINHWIKLLATGNHQRSSCKKSFERLSCTAFNATVSFWKCTFASKLETLHAPNACDGKTMWTTYRPRRLRYGAYISHRPTVIHVVLK